VASKERIRVVEGDRSITLQVGEKYRHFKGGLYTIVGFAVHRNVRYVGDIHRQ